MLVANKKCCRCSQVSKLSSFVVWHAVSMKLCWLPFKTCSSCCGIREIVFNWCIMCQINEIMLVAIRMCSCCGSISKINFIWCMTQHGNEIMMVAMMSCKCGHHVINIIFTLMRGRPYQWNHWLSIKQATGAAAPAKLPSLDAQCAMLWNHDNLKILPPDPLHWQKHLHLMGDVPYQWNHDGCHEDMQMLPLHHWTLVPAHQQNYLQLWQESHVIDIFTMTVHWWIVRKSPIFLFLFTTWEVL